MTKNSNQTIEDAVKAIVQDFLTQLGLDADVAVSFPETTKESSDFSYIKVDLSGENLGEIIGYRGGILESIQTVLGLILTKTLTNQGEENKFRLILDVNQYKDQREKYLISHAERAAEEVINSKQSLELAPMKPSERRIIHLALRGKEGILTTSAGEGENRRVVIQPK